MLTPVGCDFLRRRGWTGPGQPTVQGGPAGTRSGRCGLMTGRRCTMSIPRHDSREETLADIGEFGLVGTLAKLFEQGERVLLGPGDDAAVVAFPDGRVVVSTDLHV